jgi:glucosamine 6-phosphate synthetase-like amidotransferase/phosphosugar isomerase protein
MCGIAFFINYNAPKKMNLSIVGDSFIVLNKRGGDASGFYWERQGKDEMERGARKSAITSKELWEETQANSEFNHPKERAEMLKVLSAKDKKSFKKSEEYYKYHKLTGTERLVMCHARWKTQGTKYDNNNNHPMFSKNFVLVHNGHLSITNKVDDYPYIGDCDSEHILANIETYGMKTGIKNLAGSIAIVFKDFKEDKLYVYRRENPLDLVFLREENLLIGISDSDYVKETTSIDFPDNMFQAGDRIVELPKHRLYSIDLSKTGEENPIKHIEEIKPEWLTIKEKKKLAKKSIAQIKLDPYEESFSLHNGWH